MYKFFVEKEHIKNENIILTGENYSHIKVLRCKKGEEILISDKTGYDYKCEVSEILDKEVLCIVKEKFISESEPKTKIYLFQALGKADKMELVIQKSVELGVYEIIPITTEFTIVELDSKKEGKKVERWNKISESAAKQSKRSIIPEVKDVKKITEALEYATKLDKVLFFYEKEEKNTIKKAIENFKGENIGIFIGPEGGFSEKEINIVKKYDYDILTLGKRILRTETVPISVISILMFERGEM